jgi:uncharacterized protein YgbK (DUF1537 family)
MTLLGCIADDVTGGTDVAAALRRTGLSVTLLFDVPTEATRPPSTDAVVVALKTRTVPAEEAVAQSLACLAWLQAQRAERIYFKYCSTFDSTPDGNIGPVTEALAARLGAGVVVTTPAAPLHGRTMYQGHLFVHDRLLSESSMRQHPLTPMTDPLITRVLQHQTSGTVGLLPLRVVRDGVQAVRAELAELEARQVRHVVVDAVEEADLRTVASAVAGLHLLTGGAGLAGALGHVLVDGRDDSGVPAVELPAGPTVVLAGSCSTTTLGQVAKAAAAMPSYRLDPASCPGGMLEQGRAWLRGNLDRAPLLVYSSAPADVRAAGAPGAAQDLERTFGVLAAEAVAGGATRIVVAGGETSGAVVQSLGIDGVLVGQEADPGVPWCLATDRPLALLLKSGNFGEPDLLVRAARQGAS